MKAKVIYKSRIPRLFFTFMPVSAVTLWPFIFVREERPSATLLQHELIHIKQANELGVIGFYGNLSSTGSKPSGSTVLRASLPSHPLRAGGLPSSR